MPLLSDDTVQVLVWLLRTILPCILFWISFGPKVTLPWHSEYRRHSRQTLLRQRDVVTSAGAGVPDVLATLLLATEETAPALFQEQKKAAEKAEKRAERDRDRDRERKGGGGRERERERSSKDKGKDRRKPPLPAAGEQPAPATEVDPGRSEREQRTHLESLVNFVAFTRREQQRTFLPKEDCAPPPPPPPPRKAADAGDCPQQADGKRGEEDRRANVEAQMVLQGSLLVASRAAAVAQALYGQLTDLCIRIEPRTFELMVEGCIEANNLQAASDFLMRMESNGHVPGNELLDRLMELYLRHKRSEEQKADEAEQPPPEEAPAVQTEEPQWTAQTVDMDLSSFGHTVDDGLGLCAVAEQPMYSGWDGAVGMAADGGLVGAAAHSMQHWGVVSADTGVQGVQAVLGRYGYSMGGSGMRQRRTAGTQKTASSSSSSLPAFAVPDEFRVKGEAEKQGEAAPDSEASPQAAGSEADALGSVEQDASGADTGQAGTDSAAARATSVLSADAAVFVPGGNSQPELFAAGEPGCFAEGEVAAVADVGAGDFEFSAGAPVFLPGAAGAAEGAPPSWEPGQGCGGAGEFATEQVFLPGATGAAEGAPPSWEPGQGCGGAGAFATEQAAWGNQ